MKPTSHIATGAVREYHARGWPIMRCGWVAGRGETAYLPTCLIAWQVLDGYRGGRELRDKSMLSTERHAGGIGEKMSRVGVRRGVGRWRTFIPGDMSARVSACGRLRCHNGGGCELLDWSMESSELHRDDGGEIMARVGCVVMWVGTGVEM